MRNGFLGSMTAFVAGAGLALAQTPAAPLPAPVAQPGVIITDGPYPPGGPVPGDNGIVPGAFVGEGCAASGCGEAGCGPSGQVCGPRGQFWFSGEYLMMWMKEFSAPPLITTSPAGTLPALGPGTQVLFGGGDITDQEHPGFRLKAGVWFTQYHDFGVEANWFMLGARSNSFSASGTGLPGAPVVGIPFFDVTQCVPLGFESAFPVSSTGTSCGVVSATASSRLWNIEPDFVINLCCNQDYRVDLLAGFRYMVLSEGLGLNQDTTVLASVPFIGGTSLLVNDQFDTDNDYYGGQVGLRGSFQLDRLFGSVSTKIAFGDNREKVDIHGNTQITAPGANPLVFPVGNLALMTNSGTYSRNQFAVVPEVNFHVGFQVTKVIRVFAGYSFLYWSNVVRPGDQIDRAVNTTQVPFIGTGSLVGTPRPAFSFRDSDFWVHGINVGMEFRF